MKYLPRLTHGYRKLEWLTRHGRRRLSRRLPHWTGLTWTIRSSDTICVGKLAGGDGVCCVNQPYANFLWYKQLFLSYERRLNHPLKNMPNEILTYDQAGSRGTIR